MAPKPHPMVKDPERRKRLMKVLFVVFVLGTISGLALHLSLVVANYLDYPQVKAPDSTEPHTATFPWVTVCSPERFSESKMLLDTEFVVPSKTLKFNIAYENVRLFWLRSLFQNRNYYTLSTSERSLVEYSVAVSMLRYSVDADISFQPEDALFFCQYRDVQCDFRNFTRHVLEDRVCFRFQPATPAQYKVSQVGTEHGLHLVIFARPSNTPSREMFQPSDDIWVFVHTRATWPSTNSLERSRYNSKYVANIAFTERRFETINTPAKPCIDETVSVRRCYSGRDMVITCENFTWSPDVCLQDRWQHALHTSCGCVAYDYLLPESLANVSNCFQVPTSILISTSVELNESTNLLDLGDYLKPVPSVRSVNTSTFAETARCFWSFRRRHPVRPVGEQLPAPCNVPACVQQRYATKTLYMKDLLAANPATLTQLLSNFQKRAYNISLALNMTQRQIVTPYLYSTYSQFLNNLKPVWKVVLFPEDGGVHVSRQNLQFSPIDLMSNFGGTIGLWMDFSILSIFVVIDRVTRYLQQKGRRKANTVNTRRVAPVDVLRKL